MGLFNKDSDAVKALKEQANFIGKLFGMVHMGELSAADRDDVIGNADQRLRLQTVFATAKSEVGGDKALKIATKAANYGADGVAFHGKGSYHHVVLAAEEAVRTILT